MSLRAFPHRRLSISAAEKETDMHACPIAAGHLAFSQPMLMVVCVRMEEEIHHDGSHVALSSPQKRVSKLISIAPVDHSTMMLKHETTISRRSIPVFSLFYSNERPPLLSSFSFSLSHLLVNIHIRPHNYLSQRAYTRRYNPPTRRIHAPAQHTHTSFQ